MLIDGNHLNIVKHPTTATAKTTELSASLQTWTMSKYQTAALREFWTVLLNSRKDSYPQQFATPFLPCPTRTRRNEFCSSKWDLLPRFISEFYIVLGTFYPHLPHEESNLAR